MRKIIKRLQYYLSKRKYNFFKTEVAKMKVNIIYPESEAGWIIYKFAKNVTNELEKIGIDVQMSSCFDKASTINHYFAPNLGGYSNNVLHNYTDFVVDDRTTFMITHVDSMSKIDSIKAATDKGAIGICMSADTRDKLVASGIRRNKICYINPAQDCQIKPKKINLGFTYRLYNDNRKKNDLILDVCKEIKPDFFRFSIMGAGWDDIVKELRTMNFEVEYYPEFNKEKYNELILGLDYYCYFGFDEGSMGYLDAVAAGVGTIVTPQGYHLDTECEITFPVETYQDIVNVLQKLQNEKLKNYRFINSWTWENYTAKHLEIWKYMLRCEDLSVLLKNRCMYKDGIFSLLIDDLQYGKSIKQYLQTN